jgi:hypothetical protein
MDSSSFTMPHAAVHLGRRRFLADAGSGLGAIALAWLLHADGRAAEPAAGERPRGPHFAPKAKRAIHVFSPGGVSHVDTFDYKPALEKYDGQPLTGKGPLDPFFGKPGNLLKSLYPYRRRGQSGLWVSDLLPHLAGCVDDLVFLHAVVTKSSSHTPACFQMNTGFTLNGFPSLGSWLSYGLGSLNQQLPTFVVLPDPRGLPNGGTNNWSNGFLPAEHQGTALDTDRPEPISDLRTPAGVAPGDRQAALDLLARLNRHYADADPGDTALAARLRSYELAARMQTSIPEAIDSATRPRRRNGCTGWTTPPPPRPAATSCSPAACWSAASASCRSTTAPPSAATRASTGTPTRTSRPTTTPRPSSSTGRVPRCCGT